MGGWRCGCFARAKDRFARFDSNRMPIERCIIDEFSATAGSSVNSAGEEERQLCNLGGAQRSPSGEKLHLSRTIDAGSSALQLYLGGSFGGWTSAVRQSNYDCTWIKQQQCVGDRM